MTTQRLLAPVLCLMLTAAVRADAVKLRQDVQKVVQQAQLSQDERDSLKSEVQWIKSNASRPERAAVARLREDASHLDVRDPRLLTDVRTVLESAGIPPEHVAPVCAGLNRIVNSPTVQTDDLRQVVSDLQDMRGGRQ